MARVQKSYDGEFQDFLTQENVVDQLKADFYVQGEMQLIKRGEHHQQSNLRLTSDEIRRIQESVEDQLQFAQAVQVCKRMRWM